MLNAEKLEQLTATGLAGFADEAVRLVDAEGETLFYRFMTSDFPTVKEALAATDLPLSPYVFNRALNNELTVPTVTKTSGKGKNAKTTTLAKALGFPGPLDYAIITAAKEVTTLNTSPEILQIACQLLERPVQVDEVYFNTLYATLVHAIRDVTSRETKLKIMGAFTSLLVGIDVQAILDAKHSTYHGHVHAYEGTAPSTGESLSGFLPWHFLPLRIFYTMQLLLDLQLKEIADRDLEEKMLALQPTHPELSTHKATREYLIKEVTKELKRNLQTYWITRSGGYIQDVPVAGRQPLIHSLAKGISASIKNLADNDSVVLYLGWGDKKGGHATYLQIHKRDSAWNIMIHNLGASNDLHKTSLEGLVYPYIVSQLKQSEDWQEGGAGLRYINGVLKALYPLSDEAVARPIYYDQGKDRVFSPEQRGVDIEKLYEPRPKQTAGNCVYENHSATRVVHFPALYKILFWARESERSGFYEQHKVPDIDLSPLLLLSDKPQHVIPEETIEIDQKLLHDPVAAFKKAYKDAYEYIPSVSSIWAAKQKMDDYFVKLSLEIRRASAEQEDQLLRSMDPEELLKNGGHQWIVGQFGSGKSTFLQNIAYRWAKDDATIKDAYDYVVLFPLRQLQHIVMSGDTPEQKIASILGHIYFDRMYKEEIRDEFAKRLFAEDVKTLWLLDGWNEIDSTVSAKFKEIIDCIRRQKNVFISTRPLALEREQAEQPHVVVKGLSDDKIAQWMDTHINDPKLVDSEDRGGLMGKKSLLLQRLRSNARVWELAHYPIILKIICMALVEGNDLELNSLASIYKVMFTIFANHLYHDVENEKIPSYWKGPEKILAILARRILDNDDRVISPRELLDAIKVDQEDNFTRNWPSEIMQSGLVTPAFASLDSKKLVPISFVHDSFYEYLAAKMVIAVIHKDPDFMAWFSEHHKDPELMAWFSEHKYEARYQVVWRFVSGLIEPIELANEWFKLWFNEPFKFPMKNADFNPFEDIADFIMESRFKDELPLRDDLVKFINGQWGADITQVPKAVVKLIKATSLWRHEEAKPWLEQVKAQLILLNNNTLPRRGGKGKIGKEIQDAFYNAMNNIARLLKSIYSDDESVNRFVQDFFYPDLYLRVDATGANVNKKLNGVIEGPRATLDEYLRYRQHALAVLIKIKMQIHDEATLDQLEDVLLWCMSGSYTTEILQFALKAIADSKLNDANINGRLLVFLKEIIRGRTQIETTQLMVLALSEQASKDTSILPELLKLLNFKNERQMLEPEYFINNILDALSKYRYAEPDYLKKLLGLLAEASAYHPRDHGESDNTKKVIIRVRNALAQLAGYAGSFTEQINAALAEQPNPSKPGSDKKPAQEAEFDALLAQAQALLSPEASRKRKRGQDPFQLVNQAVGILISKVANQEDWEKCIPWLAWSDLDPAHAHKIISQVKDVLFQHVHEFKINQPFLYPWVESINIEADGHCKVHWKQGGGSTRYEMPEAGFWHTLCDASEMALTKAFAAEDPAAALFGKVSPTQAATAPAFAGSKRQREPMAPLPVATSSVKRGRPGISTVNLGDQEYQVNTQYEYEDQDMTAILNARFRAIEGVRCLTAVDTITPDSLYDRLGVQRASDKGITVIPCNIGRYHWVGLLFQFNEHRECIRAEFINSTGSPLPKTLQQQLSKKYPSVVFQTRFDLHQQNDGTSCGACTIENLRLAATGAMQAPQRTMAGIRAEHLQVLQQDINIAGLSHREKTARDNFYTLFNRRQQDNRPSFMSGEYPGFKESEPKSEAELLGIAMLGSLLLNLATEPKKALLLAFSTAASGEKSHAEVLGGIRAVLWRYVGLADIDTISRRLFGIARGDTVKGEIINSEERYHAVSELIFEYNYLKDIHQVCVAGDPAKIQKDIGGSVIELTDSTVVAATGPLVDQQVGAALTFGLVGLVPNSAAEGGYVARE